LLRRNDLLIILSLLYSLSSFATLIAVKQDGTGNFTTIQAAVNSAATGDTVLVWPGTYFENINYLSKNIIIASLYLFTGDESDINTTIIDGANNGSCAYISNIIGNNAKLCGFTIQHGSGYSSIKNGGGIYINNSFIHISNCIIKNNISRNGGGIFGQSSEIYLKGNTIKENRAIANAGGVLIIYNSTMNFDTIELNSLYLNHGKLGCDFTKSADCPLVNIVLDTGTVLIPDNYFYYSYNENGYPVNDIYWQINHSKVNQANANLYVDPYGNNENTGLTLSDPLKTIAYALKKIIPDSLDPKTIFLSQGVYSSSNNSEIFPVIQRNSISLIGSGSENTIIDAEYSYPLYFSNIYTSNFSIKNIAFMHGDDDNQYTYGIISCLSLVENDNVFFYNVKVAETKGYLYSALCTSRSNISVQNSQFINNAGGYPIAIFNTGQVGQNSRVVNICNSFVSNNVPGETIEEGRGGAVGFVGSYSFPNATHGRLSNALILENTYITQGMNFGICGLSCSENAIVYVINSTIANNIVTNPVPGGQVYASEGAEINFYNSIVYGTEDYEIFLGNGTPTSDIATVNISNTNVKGGEENIQNWNNIHVLNWLDGNMDNDPLWEGGEPFSLALQPGSPCINAGVPMYEPGLNYPYIQEEQGKYVLYILTGDTVTLPPTDLAGNPRISGGRIDMGAYEWQDTATISSTFKVQSSKLSVYPNPFTSNVFVSFSTEKEQMLELMVIDMHGTMVKSITSGRFPAGDYRLVWNGKDEDGFELKAGNYVVCLYLDSKPVGHNQMLKL